MLNPCRDKETRGAYTSGERGGEKSRRRDTGSEFTARQGAGGRKKAKGNAKLHGTKKMKQDTKSRTRRGRHKYEELRQLPQVSKNWLL